MPYSRKNVRTMASKKGLSTRPRRRSAYATLARPMRRYALNVSPNSVYKYNQYAYSVTLSRPTAAAAGTINSSNTNVVELGTSQTDSLGLYFVGGIIKPRLNNIDGASSFLGMYDQYRIKGVKVTFTPLFNSANYSQVQGTTTAGAIYNSPIPELILARDYDDNVIPTGTTMEFELMQRMDTQLHRLDTVKSFYMKLKPRVPNIVTVDAGGVQSQGISVGTGNEWIDVTSSGLVYPSFKFVLRYLNLDQYYQFAMRVDCKYYIEFKNVR